MEANMAKTNFTIDEQLGIFTLTNPPLNLIDMEMLDEFEAFLDNIAQYDIRAILLQAEGDMFSAGVNVEDVFKGRSQSEALAMLERFNHTLSRFEQLPLPTLAVVHGDCYTAGFEMVLACDMAWAADTAKLGLIEAVIGTTPMGGGTQRLTQRVGAARAAEMIMSASFYDAATLEKWHIINRVLPQNELMDKALRFAKRLSKGPTLAYAATKLLIRETRDNGIKAADKRLPEIAAPLFESEDMRHGIESLMTNGPGKANFKGK